MRQTSAELNAIINGTCESHSTLALTMRDGSIQYHATAGGIVANLPNRPATAFTTALLEVGKIRQSLTSAVDNLSVKVKNVDRAFGAELLRNDRRIEFAFAEIGRVWRVSSNDAWNYQALFLGRVTSAKANHIVAELEITSLFASVGAIIGSRPYSARCALIFKSFECGYTGALTTCDKQLNSQDGCAGRNQKHRFAGFYFPGNPVNQTPGTDPNDGGGIGGGGGVGGNGDCFDSHTKIKMVDGSSKRICTVECGDEVMCFDSKTERIVRGIVTKTYRRSVDGVLRVRFSNGQTVFVTSRHRFFQSAFFPNSFKAIGDYKTGENVRHLNESGELGVLQIASIEKVTKQTEVYNFTVEPFHTYFANEIAVSNSKQNPFDTPNY